MDPRVPTELHKFLLMGARRRSRSAGEEELNRVRVSSNSFQNFVGCIVMVQSGCYVELVFPDLLLFCFYFFFQFFCFSCMSVIFYFSHISHLVEAVLIFKLMYMFFFFPELTFSLERINEFCFIFLFGLACFLFSRLRFLFTHAQTSICIYDSLISLIGFKAILGNHIHPSVVYGCTVYSRFYFCT